MASKDSHDPGWNDPPIFTYDKATAIQASATRKGTVLNKRVAFPISGNLGNQQSNPPGNDLSKPPMSHLPPLSTPPSIRTDISMPPCEKPKTDDSVQPEERLNKTLKNLQEEANCDEEILKRINVMEKMWTDGKLEVEVQCRIYDLSEALMKGDMETVDHIQKGLMVDYVSQCGSWMSGIRQLINQKKRQQQGCGF